MTWFDLCVAPGEMNTNADLNTFEGMMAIARLHSPE